MNKKLLAGILSIPFIVLIIWISYLFYLRSTGTDIVVAIQGYDPRDLLSGHYIQYTINWSQTDCSQFPGKACRPNEFCHKATWGRQCRFYIPEEYAERLDDLFRNRWSGGHQFQVVYSYNPKRAPLAKQLLIDGKDWTEALK